MELMINKLSTKKVKGKTGYFPWLKYWGFLAFFLTASMLYADAYSVIQTVPNELEVNEGSKSGSIKVVNITGSEALSVSFNIDFPTGFEYEIGSIAVGSAIQSLVETNSKVCFNVGNFAADDTLSISYSFIAKALSIQEHQNGSVFRNLLTIDDGTHNETDYSSSYNVLYAALTIMDITPSFKSVTNGDSFTRDIEILNGGYGSLSSFELSTTNDTTMDVIGNSIGVDIGSGTLQFGASDFAMIGNGDAYFDRNETLVLTQTYSTETCQNENAITNYEVSWYGGGESYLTDNSLATTAITYQYPSLAISVSENMPSCLTGVAQQSVTYSNNSDGTAHNLIMDFYKSTGGGYNENILSSFDVTGVTYQLNGGPITAITPTEVVGTKSTGNFSCLGVDPKGKFTVSFPELKPGEALTVYWDQYTCCPAECSDDPIGGWGTSLSYNDACNLNTYTDSKIGQNDLYAKMEMFTETPADVYDDKKYPFRFLVSSYNSKFDNTAASSFQLKFQLPNGLVFENLANDLLWGSAPFSWAPTSVNYDSITREIFADFSGVVPFSINKTELTLMLKTVCDGGANSGDNNVVLNVWYNVDTSCVETCRIKLICNETSTTYLHCPGDCDTPGAFLSSFEGWRKNLGSPDVNNDGLPEAGPITDNSTVRINRLMVGDTLKTRSTSIVKTDLDHPSWGYGEGFINMFKGNNFTNVSSKFTLIRNSNGDSLIHNGLPISTALYSNRTKWFYDFSPTALVGLGNPAFNGIVFEEGDTLIHEFEFVVTENIGGDIEEFLTETQVSLKETANGSKFKCNDLRVNNTLIGYFFRTASVNNITISSCSKYINQSFYFSVGSCCSNYAGGNLFPNEYRNWSHVKRGEFTIPENYRLVDVYFKHFRSKGTNRSASQTVNNLSPVSVSGRTYQYDLEQLFEPFGGNVKYSDEGYKGTLYAEIAPTCDIEQGVFKDMDWSFSFHKEAPIGFGETEWYTRDPDRIKYSPTSIQLSSTNQTVDGIEKEVTWEVKVKNNTSKSDADFVWLYFENYTDDIQVTEVKYASNGVALEDSNGIYKVGSINKNKSVNVLISATYSNCSPADLYAFSGYQCIGYPDSIQNFHCPKVNLPLHLLPKKSQLQVRMDAEVVGDDCSPETQITLNILNSRWGYADSIKVSLTNIDPLKINYKTATSSLKYPMTGSYDPSLEPTSEGDSLTWLMSDLDSYLNTNAFPGVTNLSRNEMSLRFNILTGASFTNGDRLQMEINGESVCGDHLTTLALDYDPNVTVSVMDIPPVTSDPGDNWSVSWGDFNNDGYDDLFLTDYDISTPNTLYKNNGDKTFTDVTVLAGVSDMASSVSSTWGDYDNDGYLDLFVANNKGKANFLYHNNGDGTFTRITNDPISNYDGYCHSAAWADYDNDGYLDLFVVNYFSTMKNVLYHNNGSGGFTQVTNALPAMESGASIGVSWSDYDGDGDVDLYVTNRNQNNYLYRNDGRGNFAKIENLTITEDVSNSVGSSWGDYDNDKDLDLFVANAGDQVNVLYRNDGGVFTETSLASISSKVGDSHGSDWMDFDNDGYLDLFVTNDQNASNYFYLNQKNGDFETSLEKFEELNKNSFGLAYSDFDNDGDFDMYIANHSGQTNDFFENVRGKCTNWICFNLEGTVSNRSAIGAKINVLSNIGGNPVWQTREVSSQSGGGAGGQNTLRQIFGLGTGSTADSVIVEWPSGIRQHLINKPANLCYDVQESTGSNMCGVVYNDENRNCIMDSSEKGLPYQTIIISPIGKSLTTDENGAFNVYLSNGDYTIEVLGNDKWERNCVFAEAVNINSSESCGHNFGLNSPCTKPDLSLNVATTVFRKGFTNVTTIKIENTGNIDANGVVLNALLGENLYINSSDNAFTSLGNNQYQWSLPSMPANSELLIHFTDSVGLEYNIGDSVQMNFDILDISGECNTSDNTFALLSDVKGAIDPNDKLVYYEGGKSVTYKIRFQNIGNYPATFVRLMDTLDAALDPRTVSNIISSHEYSFQRYDNALYWYFDHINLPDSISNPVESQGFVQFDVRIKESHSSFDDIPNVANIQFDYNDWIHTNNAVVNYYRPVDKTVSLFEINNGETDQKVSGLIYPNPVVETSRMRLNDQIVVKSFKVFDMNGRVIREDGNFKSFEIVINSSDYDSGYYILQIEDVDGQRKHFSFLVQ